MIDNMCHRKRNDYKIDMAIDTFWHESIVHKIGKVLINQFIRYRGEKIMQNISAISLRQLSDTAAE